MGRDGLSDALLSLLHLGLVWGTSSVHLHNSPWLFVLDYLQGAHDSVTLGSKGICIGFCKRKRISAVLRGIQCRFFLLFFWVLSRMFFNAFVAFFFLIRVMDSLFQSDLKCEHRHSLKWQWHHSDVEIILLLHAFLQIVVYQTFKLAFKIGFNSRIADTFCILTVSRPGLGPPYLYYCVLHYLLCVFIFAF